MLNHLSLKPLLACLLTLALSIGCGHTPPASSETASDGHDHEHGHDHPEPNNFTEALANVEDINHELSEAFVAGDHDEADHALHEAFDAVKALGEMATKDGFDEEKGAEVAAASEALLTAYDYLHGVHGGKEVDYGEVKSDIETAIARLAAVDPNHPEDHDHGDDHDEDHDHDSDQQATE